MRTYSVIFLLFVICGLNAQVPRMQRYEPKYSTVIPEERSYLIVKQQSREFPGYISYYFNPDKQDIYTLETTFYKLSGKTDKAGRKIGSLDQYVYQYTGVIIDGYRYIYINAFDVAYFKIFPDWEHNWAKQPINYVGGGEAFWGVLFDIQRKSFVQLRFNTKK